ncbi:esterase, putative [Bodo saltans]|uniref:Esterase, putative n=1 Tax=Bodo saltans TaxID=75058 RepID=A0A0S4IZQ3_BODSA|nr:esterase, putative [Bodo saltans]|eukprot:CUG06015.1 esterase, putative [Bodo saltans]
MQNILLLGDSLTEQGYENQWCAHLQNYYQRRADVVCRGFGGYNTKWILDILQSNQQEKIIPAHLPGHTLFCVVFLGANDAVSAEYPQHVPVDQYEANLRAITRILLEDVRPLHGVVLMTPPPIDQERYLEYVRRERVPDATTSSRNLETTRQYRNAVLKVAGDTPSTIAVDLYKAFLANLAEQPYQSRNTWSTPFFDGLHFDATGGQIVFSELKNSLPAQALPEKFPTQTPHWSTLTS